MKISTSENIQEVIAELVLLFNSFLRTFVDAIIIKWRKKFISAHLDKQGTEYDRLQHKS